jgi:hypothetical protein
LKQIGPAGAKNWTHQSWTNFQACRALTYGLFLAKSQSLAYVLNYNEGLHTRYSESLPTYIPTSVSLPTKQLDYFGIACVAYTLLNGAYMKPTKDKSGRYVPNGSFKRSGPLMGILIILLLTTN